MTVEGRMGVVLQGVHDGISVYIEPDGTMLNCWDEAHKQYPDDAGITRRWQAANKFIEESEHLENGN